MKAGFRLLFLFLCCTSAAGAQSSGRDGNTYPFRTDTSGEQLPWYKIKPGEFPPRHSEHCIAGELVAADFIHRCGQFRIHGTGELVDFRLLSCGIVRYMNADADLRDIPLGTLLRFSLYQDESGGFTQAAVIEDDSSLSATAPQAATTEQRKRHTAFLKERGLAGWIERVDGPKLVVMLFGDPDDLRAILKSQNIDPGQWATEHRRVHAVVANPDLRTYNPPVDGQGSTILEYQNVPAGGYGCSGIRWIIKPSLMLEGFRKGHVIRLFPPAWPVHDMPFGEGVYTETPNAKVEEESSNQFPFRTDFGNADLPWYQLKAGEFPPYGSPHKMAGELLKVDADHRTGQFREDRTGNLINFTMPPFGGVLYHSAEAELADIPPGTHCCFYLHPDEKGAFTRADLIADDFTRTITDRVSWRIESIDLAHGKLNLAKQLGMMKDERDHLVKPPDLEHGEFAVNEKTRVWKNGEQRALSDLKVGDDLLINLSGQTSTSRGHCMEIWAGAEMHKQAAEQQRTKHNMLLKAQGVPAWVDRVEGKELTIVFFAASRKDFPAMLDGDPWGKSVQTIEVDDELHPQGTGTIKLGFKTHLPEGNTFGTYGCSGVRWVLQSPQPPPYKQGQIIRLWKEGWPGAIAEKKATK